MDAKTRVALLLAVVAAAVVGVFALLPPPEKTPAAGTPEPTGRRANAEAMQAPGTEWTESSRPAVAAEAGLTGEDWVEDLDALLTSEEDNSITARKLIAALPGLPGEAQEEYVAHAVNLCEDEDFGRLEAVYLTPSTPPEVIETIFNDALNRPDVIKLPLLVKTLANPAHPMAGESREILEMYLDLEPGTPPPAGWEVGVQQYLREQNE